MKTLYDEYRERSVTVATVTRARVTTAGVTGKCVMCGVDVGPKARTCGPVCRKRASRRREAIKREVRAVQDALSNLQRFSDRWPDLNADIQDAVSECVTMATVTLAGVTPAVVTEDV